MHVIAKSSTPGRNSSSAGHDKSFLFHHSSGVHEKSAFSAVGKPQKGHLPE
ncbi:MAG: hypothetical protein ABSC77_01185 [Terracidiphilus sp.]|jgi:hypothetical protein